MRTKEDIQARIKFLEDFRTEFTEEKAPMTHMLTNHAIETLEWVLEDIDG